MPKPRGSLQEKEKNHHWKGGIWTNDPNKYAREYLQKRRKIVVEFYGGTPARCACCGETEYAFLSIDHLNGGGTKHRESIKTNIYNWIIKNNFPDGFQILCHNCNQAKGYYGECPHVYKRNLI